MKKFLFLMTMLLALTMVMSCTKIEQGHVGLKVYLLGNDKGSIQILGPGVYGNQVNVMLDRYNRPYVLEVNSIPGLTEFSLLPKAAGAVGIGFEELCLRVLDEACKRKGMK